MTRPPHLRSGLISAALVVLAVAAWLFLPRPRSAGRPATSQRAASACSRASTPATSRSSDPPSIRVGDIVAYRSTVLHVVVLHRIVAIKGDRYVLKGDNNDFVDPPPQSRRCTSASCRARAAWRPRPRLAAHPLHGRAAHRRRGPLLLWAPSSSAAAVIAAGPRRRAPSRRCRPALGPPGVILGATGTRFYRSAVAAVAFLALGVLALTHPATKPVAQEPRTPRRSASATTPRRPPGRSTPTASSRRVTPSS